MFYIGDLSKSLGKDYNIICRFKLQLKKIYVL